jgi:hypothetical protein
MAQNDQALLTRLKDSGLDFVVIGGVCGVCGVYHGLSLATFDSKKRTNSREICFNFYVYPSHTRH